jgi:two-component system, cell cycle sensor histidine kinase and response regulator CckA
VGPNQQLGNDLKATDTTRSKLTPLASGTAFQQRADLTFEHISPQVAEWTGVPAARWLRDPGLFLQAIDPSDLDRVRENLRLAAASAEGVTHSFRLRHAQTDRLTHVIEYRRATLDGRGNVQTYDGLWLDVTRFAEIEQRLAAASWHEGLSAITMGVVHDFNNALAGILPLSELLFSQTDSHHPFHEALGMIHQNSQSAAKLTRRLLRLHREQVGESRIEDLNPLVADLTELLGRFIPKRIDLSSELAPKQLPVQVDVVAFQRTVIYLAINAGEAIADRGKLVLKTTLHPAPPKLRHFVGQPPRGTSACLAISDTGPGIQAHPLERVFEPFFTTKAPGQGSGLGLYHARRFAEQHGGAVSLESTQGHGCTVRLWLPCLKLE